MATVREVTFSNVQVKRLDDEGNSVLVYPRPVAVNLEYDPKVDMSVYIETILWIVIVRIAGGAGQDHRGHGAEGVHRQHRVRVRPGEHKAVLCTEAGCSLWLVGKAGDYVVMILFRLAGGASSSSSQQRLFSSASTQTR